MSEILDTRQAYQKWHYQIRYPIQISNIDSLLNKMGDEGWELITCHFINRDNENYANLIFKRPVW